MNDIQIFDYNNRQIRTINKDGEPWFVLKDVCDVLGLSDTNKTADRLDEDELTRIKFVSGGQTREMYIVSEPGIYNVIIRSDKPEAKQFKRWITHEILPSIRKTGGYVSSEELFINEYLSGADERTKAMFRANLETMRTLNAKIVEDTPKVALANAVCGSRSSILVRELAKIICQNGVEMGEKRLYNWLRDNGYLIKHGADYNTPTQRAINAGLFEIVKRDITLNSGRISISSTTKITGKGQQYFINLFLSSNANKCSSSNIRSQ